jgi:trk system potassium uptake protein TrkA
MPDLPYVIVVGGGKVGVELARHLLDRGYETTLVEKNPDRAAWISEELGSASVMVGDGDEMGFLPKTGIERASVLVAATGDDEDNLVVCLIAKHRFHVKHTIARVNTPSNAEMFKKLGVDTVLSTTDVLVNVFEQALNQASAV